jgi:hypothetical protein
MIMICEKVKIWKEVVMAYCKLISQYYIRVDTLRKNYEKPIYHQFKIQTRYCLYTSEEYYCYTSLLKVSITEFNSITIFRIPFRHCKHHAATYMEVSTDNHPGTITKKSNWASHTVTINNGVQKVLRYTKY